MTNLNVGTGPTSRPLHLAIMSAMEDVGVFGTEHAEKITELQKLRAKQKGKLGKKKASKLASYQKKLDMNQADFRRLASLYIGSAVSANHDEIRKTITTAVAGMKIKRSIHGNAVIFDAVHWIDSEKERVAGSSTALSETPAPMPAPRPVIAAGGNGQDADLAA